MWGARLLVCHECVVVGGGCPVKQHSVKTSPHAHTHTYGTYTQTHTHLLASVLADREIHTERRVANPTVDIWLWSL